jgi:hypothetical protein
VVRSEHLLRILQRPLWSNRQGLTEVFIFITCVCAISEPAESQPQHFVQSLGEGIGQLSEVGIVQWLHIKCIEAFDVQRVEKEVRGIGNLAVGEILTFEKDAEEVKGPSHPLFLRFAKKGIVGMDSGSSDALERLHDFLTVFPLSRWEFEELAQLV